MNRKGQAAIEFLILSGFMLVVFTTFFVVVQERASLRQQQVTQNELLSASNIVRQEVSMANQVRAGYARIFELPLLINEQEYTIDLYPEDAPSEMVIRSGELEYVIFLPVNMTEGTYVGPGYNRITKENDNITINNLNRQFVCTDSSDCGQSDACITYECVDGGTAVAECRSYFTEEGVGCMLESRDGYCDGVGSCLDCDNDGDGYESGFCTAQDADCSDDDPAINPGAGEICDDNVDNDCNGDQDCADSACSTSPLCTYCALNGPAGSSGNKWVAYPAGTSWTLPGIADERRLVDSYEYCCDADSQCIWEYSDKTHTCTDIGEKLSWYWICEDDNQGQGVDNPTWFACGQDNDGEIFSGRNADYCCSKSQWPGHNLGYRWNDTPRNWKMESLSNDQAQGYTSCSDGSDNDCDGSADFDGLWSGQTMLKRGDAACTVDFIQENGGYVQGSAGVNAGDSISLTCHTSQPGLQCIRARVNRAGEPWASGTWSGNDVTFAIPAPSLQVSARVWVHCNINSNICTAGAQQNRGKWVWVCAPGSSWNGAECAESACSDGIDNDGDGNLDSADADCCSGCFIGGTCYAQGASNPSNQCQQCNTAQSDTTWSNVPNGASCDDDVFCNGADSCYLGNCAQHAGDPCGSGVCDEQADSCLECQTNADCTWSGQPYCWTTYNSCEECLDNSHCSAAEPHCLTRYTSTGTPYRSCYECILNSECSVPQNKCEQDWWTGTYRHYDYSGCTARCSSFNFCEISPFSCSVVTSCQSGQSCTPSGGCA